MQPSTAAWCASVDYLQAQPVPHVLDEVGGVLAVVELFIGVDSVDSRW